MKTNPKRIKKLLENFSRIQLDEVCDLANITIEQVHQFFTPEDLEDEYIKAKPEDKLVRLETKQNDLNECDEEYYFLEKTLLKGIILKGNILKVKDIYGNPYKLKFFQEVEAKLNPTA